MDSKNFYLNQCFGTTQQNMHDRPASDPNWPIFHMTWPDFSQAVLLAMKSVAAVLSETPTFTLTAANNIIAAQLLPQCINVALCSRFATTTTIQICHKLDHNCQITSA